MTNDDDTALLRAARLRVTSPRLAVLRELRERPHADADQVRSGVRARLGTISTQAVYDVLHALTEARILRRVEPAGAPARYEIDVGDNHHHLVCRRCGLMLDVACSAGPAPCLEAREDHGFRIDEAEVIYWGTCPSCLSTQSA